MTHVVTGNCRFCRYTDCVATCPVACFHVNDVRVYIDPDVCIDCSACIPACPVHAIVEEYDLPAEEQHWIEINARESKRYPVIRAKLPPLAGADERRAQLGL
jgi:ferredoxin